MHLCRIPLQRLITFNFKLVTDLAAVSITLGNQTMSVAVFPELHLLQRVSVSL